MKNNSLPKIEKIILKVLSLIIAAALWLFISYTLNPEMTKEFTDVDIEYLMPKDNSLVILNSFPYETDIKLKGKRNEIISLSSDDIRIFVDLRYASFKEKDFKVEVKLPAKKKITIAEQKDYEVKLDLDEYIASEMPVELMIKDLDDDNKWLSCKSNPSSIIVRGAKSELAKIKKLYVEYDSEDFNDEEDQITHKELTKNILIEPKISSDKKINVELDKKQVSLVCDLMQKKECKLVCKKLKIKDEKLTITSQTLSNEKINVRGLYTDLQDIKFLLCEPEMYENIRLAGTYKLKIKIDLPKNVKTVSKEDVYLNFKVENIKKDDSESDKQD